jgi:hypothetical protein
MPNNGIWTAVDVGTRENTSYSLQLVNGSEIRAIPNVYEVRGGRDNHVLFTTRNCITYDEEALRRAVERSIINPVSVQFSENDFIDIKQKSFSIKPKNINKRLE